MTVSLINKYHEGTWWLCLRWLWPQPTPDIFRYYIGLCEEAGITDDQRGISHHVTNPEEVSLVSVIICMTFISKLEEIIDRTDGKRLDRQASETANNLQRYIPTHA